MDRLPGCICPMSESECLSEACRQDQCLRTPATVAAIDRRIACLEAEIAATDYSGGDFDETDREADMRILAMMRQEREARIAAGELAVLVVRLGHAEVVRRVKERV